MRELSGKFSVHWPASRKNAEQNSYPVVKARSNYTLSILAEPISYKAVD